MDLGKLATVKPPALPSSITDADVKKAHGAFVKVFNDLQGKAKTFKDEVDKGVKSANDDYVAIEKAVKAASGPARNDLMKFLDLVKNFKRDYLA